MPWCDGCDRFSNPSSLAPDGTCARCGRFIASPDDEPDEDDDSGRAPWHFYVLIVAVVVYLGWRFIQLIGLILRHF